MLGLCPVAAVSTYSEYDMTHTVYINDCCILKKHVAFIIVIAAYMIGYGFA